MVKASKRTTLWQQNSAIQLQQWLPPGVRTWQPHWGLGEGRAKQKHSPVDLPSRYRSSTFKGSIAQQKPLGLMRVPEGGP
ncbi:hypothetical protein GGTG_03289 [Gaeumannomyces tritici R3-111a-1]|uniref:Uncharacterized protein n=1 Tax=Gaeumannomyces tritici (strain R3-111a-1) TaxID=644352 RepID=J3NPT2_GAET3|nr:hypothetical protein GGTG_03289 [Gaeumannomyces tritici R3-111a-1]EJT78187.1 hypothetical protein GGTG_03289 [Gaeumannomyces tritici R3-111a-1]